MAKKNKFTAVIFSIFFFFIVTSLAEEGIKESLNKKRPVECLLLVKDLLKKECYSIVIIPVVLNTKNDPFHDQLPPYLSSKNLAIINGENTKTFLKLLSECSAVTEEMVLGTQYEMIVLMNSHPTSAKQQAGVRISEGRIILNFNDFNIEATDALKVFIKSLLLPLNKT